MSGTPVSESELMESRNGDKMNNTEKNGLMGRNNEGYVHHRNSTDLNSPDSQLNLDLINVKLASAKQVNGHHSAAAAAINSDFTAAPLKLYAKRWLVLALFVLYSMSNAFQWIQYSIISNVVTEYYDVSNSAVNWTSMVYMVVYIPLIFPASMLLDRRGLRCVVIIGSFGTALGAWIKCASIDPSRFYVTMIGQTIAAISQIFVLNIPPRLASVWFGAREISTACSIGVFGNQFGIALGFLLPPMMVPVSSEIKDVENGLTVMFYGVAGFTTLLFLIILIVFKAEPASPPSPAAASAKLQLAEQESYLRSIYRLIKNASYVWLLVSYGINTGVFYAISTLLNQQVLTYFPNDSLNAGRIGLTIVVSGMAGSVICGLWLDKTHRFKETTLAIYILSLVGMVAYTFIFKANAIWTVFLIAGFLGFFMTGYLPVGFEFAAEITYPESEGTSAGLLNAAAQVFGIACTIAGGAMMEKSDTLSNLIMSGLLLIGVGMTVFVKSNLKRSAAQNQLTVGGGGGGKEEELSKPNGHLDVI